MKDTELIRAKSFSSALVAYSFRNLAVVNVTADINDFRFISIDTSRVSREEVCLPSFDVVTCLLK